MSEMNPYASSSSSQESPGTSRVTSQLSLCRVGVVVVMVVVALAAIVHAIGAVHAAAEFARQPRPEFSDNALMRSLAEAQMPNYRYAFRRAFVSTGTAVLLTAFAYFLWAYSRALMRATQGTIALQDLLPKEAACWLAAAFLALAAIARSFVNF